MSTHEAERQADQAREAANMKTLAEHTSRAINELIETVKRLEHRVANLESKVR
jgi:methyl-accepting chemotaxis protein